MATIVISSEITQNNWFLKGGGADLDQNNDFFLMHHIRDTKYWRTELKTVRHDKRWRWSALSLL